MCVFQYPPPSVSNSSTYITCHTYLLKGHVAVGNPFNEFSPITVVEHASLFPEVLDTFLPGQREAHQMFAQDLGSHITGNLFVGPCADQRSNYATGRCAGNDPGQGVDFQ